MNKSQIILFGSLGVIVLVAILMLLGVIPGLKKDVSTVSASLTVWGMSDSPDVWRDIIAVYNGPNPNIKITYIQKNSLTYETELLDALASGTGPDIWEMPQAFILKHKNKVFPLPEVTLKFTKGDFQGIFADAAWSYIQDKQIIGIPFTLDTLALYYNKDIFNSENIPNPPVTWDDLVQMAQKVSKRSLTGELIQNGVALGAVKNIEHAVDIISGLFLQAGVKIIDPETQKSDIGTKEAESALEFYRGFADRFKKHYSWSDTAPSSLQAFADSKLAMVFGFSSDYNRIIAKNPRLNFGIAPFPQSKGQTIKINYGISSGYTVSRTSQSPIEAWKFLIFAGADPTAVKFYLNATLRPPAYRQYVVSGDFLPAYLGVFQQQVLSAKTWLQPDERAVLTIFQNMVQSARGSGSAFGSVSGSAAGQLERLLESIKPPATQAQP